MRFSEDGFLDGRIAARQPVEGFRSGTDAVILAATVPANAGDELLEVGSGSGVASLCVAARVLNCRIIGIEIAPSLVELANDNVRVNGLAERVRFEEADIFQLPKHLRREFNHVLCNPPFHDSAGELSPNADRVRALSDRDGLDNWIKAAFARVVSDGILTLILRADRLGEALAAAPQHGAVVFPLWPRAGEPAKRVILQIAKNSRRSLMLLPGLVLHDDSGRYTPEAETVLRGGGSLAVADPRQYIHQ